MKPVISIVLPVIALAGACFTQTPAAPEGTTPEMAAVIANDRAYEAAYAKGDAKALADFFTDDAEYNSEDGSTLSGRAEIEESLRAQFLTDKGSKLAISVDSVKVLSPDVVVEKGSTTVTEKNGDTSGALYTAIHVKKDGKWRITNLVESPLPDDDAVEHQLEELSWLIGVWEDTDKGDDVTVRSQYSWSRGNKFITRNVSVKQGGEVTMEGWQIIGWDAVEQKVRSWTFDSEGGFSQGTFTSEGNRWLLRETGVTPDGHRTTGDSTITKASDTRFTWESANRTLDGEPQPGIRPIEVNRVKGD
ncbi:uncharacterized protein (TIGR02246 family) [Roseimicrobium gellanilyticum]|uniref:Uncharacterized protein (TIGR02246 family) n=1 Tax=Roseimicrobium gellanilyticum TaxID=748857 RepID=A0A366HXY3_9BACT|nr:SgcJ/EcaC family oxidoreductase [Roseimicrobium gellanilyticum]RBP48178.1 uncharacterized protein (TIGR02246 family) [Roseimicrobium gellanilyticum]